MRMRPAPQGGATLIEVLVTVLILSFGMLALSGMLAYAVQMPKFSAYRSSAVMMGAAHVEKMRANATGFRNGSYLENMTYVVAVGAPSSCAYPLCDAGSIAAMDKYDSASEARLKLPEGGMRVSCPGTPQSCALGEGDLWIMWQEPATFASINAASSDECPDPATVAPLGSYTFAIQPRCIHIRFKI
jgi:type IV pilus assembly protein PilV